jgi:hypothetical protein
MGLSFDPEFDDRCRELLAREAPTKSDDIAPRLAELDACANAFRMIERQRERNLREAQEVRIEVERLKTEVKQFLAQQADPSAVQRGQEIMNLAMTLATNVPSKTHPDAPPKVVEEMLDTIRRQIAENRLSLAQLATAAPSRPPTANGSGIEMLVFTTDQGDLKRLADIYRSDRPIRSVEVR